MIKRKGNHHTGTVFSCWRPGRPFRMQVLRRFGNGCPPIQGAPLLECQRLPLLNSIVVGLEVERNDKKSICYLSVTYM